MVSNSDFVRTLVLILAFLLLMGSPILGNYISKYPFEDQYYPIWKNSLFAGFPFEVENYCFYIMKLNDQSFGENGAPFFQVFPASASNTPGPSVIFYIMGQSLEAGRMDTLRLAKAKLDHLKFNKFKYVKYEMRKCKWRPIERYRKGNPDNEIVLSEFEYIQ